VLGQHAQSLINSSQDTRLHRLKTPLDQNDLNRIGNIELAIISDLDVNIDKQAAIELLSTIRNRHAKCILLITNKSDSINNDWQITDYLAMGFKTIASNDTFQIYSYNIHNYQQKRDWLNSLFWANPEYFNKFRW